MIPYLLIGVMASGSVINSITEGHLRRRLRYDYGVPQWLASLVICIVVLIYVSLVVCVVRRWPTPLNWVFMVRPDHILHHLNKLGGLEQATENGGEKGN